MLAPANRLRHRRDFTAAVRGGARSGRRTLVVHLLAGAPGTDPRVGFVVGKNVGAAVVRNRVRRRLRHITRPHLERLTTPPGVHVVIRALPAAAHAPSATLAADLAAALGSALRTAGTTR